MAGERNARADTRRGASRVGGALRDPVALILVLAATFDWLSGNPVHSLLLFATAIALVWDARRRHRAAQPAIGAERRPATAAETGAETAVGTRASTFAFACLAFVYAFFVGGFTRYSWPATVLVVVPGAVAIALAWRGPLRSILEPEPLPPLGIVAWSSLFISLGIWELIQLLLQPSLSTDSYAHPTISVTMDPILAHHPGRTIVMFIWLVGGWLLVQR